MSRQLLPIHTYIVMTEPLSTGELAEIGWHRRTSLETARNFIHYFRLTADNRIVFGGDDAKLFPGGGLRDTDAASFARLEARLRGFFPTLRAEVTHRWGGVLGVTLDMFPTFGVNGEGRALFHACGYSGHGVALANYAGRIVAPAVLERLGIEVARVEPPLSFGRVPFKLPPRPLTYLGMQVYRLALHAQDRWQGA